MEIGIFESNEQILREIGIRIRIARIRSGRTQTQLAIESGVAKTTVERTEKGKSIQILNIIKLLRSLNALSGLETLLPSAEITPMEQLERKRIPQRIRIHKKSNNNLFKWGDDE